MKPSNRILVPQLNSALLKTNMHIVTLHYIPHTSCSDFFNFCLMTATTITTITMRIINTTTVVAIAAMVPPLRAEEPSWVSRGNRERQTQRDIYI